MTLFNFEKAMEARGCVGNQRTFCGSYEGYPFTVNYLNGNNRVSSYSLSINVEGTPTGNFKRAYKQRANARARGKSVLSTTVNTATIQFQRIKDDEFNNIFDGALQDLVATAREQGHTTAQNCILCGAPGCDSFAYVRQAYRPAHQGCVQNMTATTQHKAERNLSGGSYALGAVGAVLGALVGALPSILTIYFFNAIVWLLYALVPLAAYQGYKLLRGKLNYAGAVVSIVASLLVIPVIHYIVFAVQWFSTWGSQLSVNDYVLLIKMYGGEMVSDYGTLLLGTAIGVAIMWRFITQTSSGEVRDAEFSAATLRPIGGAAPAPMAGQPVERVAPTAAPFVGGHEVGSPEL